MIFTIIPLLVTLLIIPFNISSSYQVNNISYIESSVTSIPEQKNSVFYDVPLYSQISDISSPEWKQKGCGVADLAMIIEFYKPNTTTTQKVLEAGISGGAYVKNVGWSHIGLADLSKKYGLEGKTQDFSKLNKESAFSEFKEILREGPAIASIHRGFDPKSSFGHLIVITGFDDNLVYYNDPGKRDGIRSISINEFMNGWKKRLIVVRPSENKQLASVL